MLQQLHPTVIEPILAALSGQHCSASALVQQLHFALVSHFRTSTLSFLIPIRTTAPPPPQEKRAAAGWRAASNADARAIAANRRITDSISAV